MKRNCITFLLSGIIMVSALVFGCLYKGGGSENGEYLRIHVRAHSNDERAQAVKYLVKDEVVAYLTPLAARASSKREAMSLLNEHLRGIEQAAERVLTREGFSYGATAKLTVEEFPTRVYGEYTLEKGSYDALILELGEGKGDNWWCVVYPPLCFAGENGNVTYKSLIWEKIEAWRKRR